MRIHTNTSTRARMMTAGVQQAETSILGGSFFNAVTDLFDRWPTKLEQQWILYSQIEKMNEHYNTRK